MAVQALKSPPPSTDDDASLVAVDNFIVATRDSGYKGTTSAIAELVDNAIQASSTQIDVFVLDGGDKSEHPIVIGVRDNGDGMDSATLRHALRFGGSSRFNDRAGMGRFGMGLPNASLSQARRVEVYTWRPGCEKVSSHLDVDEIIAGLMRVVPLPGRSALPSWAAGGTARSGTLVVWRRCDRLDNRRTTTIVKKLAAFLGRVFRHHIWRGVGIRINGERVRAIDPLFLNHDSVWNGGKLFGDVMKYDVDTADGSTAAVTITFSELPVDAWQALTNEEKRRRGISDGAGVSFVRAGREIELGWYMLGTKRRENYDDWWRCEIRFDAALDECFGITHTKQQIRPDPERMQHIIDDVEAVARSLNQRARKAHLDVKARTHFTTAEARASERDELLPPLPKTMRAEDPAVREIVESNRAVRTLPAPSQGETDYKIIPGKLPDTSFFASHLEEGRLVVVINPSHPFFKKIYTPLVECESSIANAAARHLELVLLAAARSECLADRKTQRDAVRDFRTHWSHAVATFLKD